MLYYNEYGIIVFHMNKKTEFIIFIISNQIDLLTSNEPKLTFPHYLDCLFQEPYLL